jgi:hypothetical protein
MPPSNVWQLILLNPRFYNFTIVGPRKKENTTRGENDVDKNSGVITSISISHISGKIRKTQQKN